MMVNLLSSLWCLGAMAVSANPLVADHTATAGGPSVHLLSAAEASLHQSRAGTRLFGTLLGADGVSLDFAQVHLQSYAGDDVLASTTVDGNGGWSLVADTSGVFMLWFSAPGHRGERVGLLLTGDEPAIQIDARLARHQLRKAPFEVTLIGEFNEFRSDRGAIPFRPRPDGRLAAEVAVTGDSLAYQLLGVALTGPIEGPGADRFSYDGSGGYRSVVDAGGPFVTVAFDPADMGSGSGRGEVRFAADSTASGRFGAYTRELFRRVDAYFETRARAADAGASTTEMRAIYEHYDPVPDARLVGSALSRESDPALRDLMRVTYMAAPIKTDPATARASLDEVPPGAAAWEVEPQGLSEALSASGDPERSREYALSVLASPASASRTGALVRSTALGWLLEDALSRGAGAELAAYHAWLVGEYPDSKAAGKAAALYAPDRRIQPGSPIPAFEVRAMGDPSTAYSPWSLSGQVVMLDFWATWCGPCITEMPFLHRAYDEFSSDGFTILSLSFDLSPEDVENFRGEGDWPMPWLHTFVEEGADSELAADLDVVNIPRAILIGRDGTILATNEALRGERLRETLARALSTGSGGGNR